MDSSGKKEITLLLKNAFPAAEMWDMQVKSVYGLETFEPSELVPQNNQNRTTSMMGVLGGDASIRETLQMQNLVAERDPTVDENAFPSIR